MQAPPKHSEARERLLDAAERLFAEKGYKGVTLRGIAKEVGIKHSSMYHHAPDGKASLFVEVITRHFQRHFAGINQAIDQAPPNVRDRLSAIADWLLSQPPMNLLRMVQSDLPALDPAQAKTLNDLAFASMLLPVHNILVEAQQNQEIHNSDLGLVAGGFFGMVNSLHAVPHSERHLSLHAMAQHLIDTLLHGLTNPNSHP